ncbi:MAG: bifunctional 3,4-dihydroxy-2-butanone-4-phosphate synthase/GTP cyclohydrolase II [Elusimicrobiota bacterium]|jgi:3,4-dihydroxy 2-butanone 4-phosphate synthase/GTP cyclohydrolase II
MSSKHETFDDVLGAVADIRKGRMVVVVDDPRRENEGDLVIAAEKATPAAVNFMAKHGRGLICVPLSGAQLSRLRIAPMVDRQAQSYGAGKDTAFTVSVDARRGTGTGISAADRSRSIRLLASPSAKPEDFIRPGHVFPLHAREGGVLVRAGHTEAAVDLARLAGLKPAGAICEIMNADGTMSRLPHLNRFAKRHGLRILTIRALIAHRRKTERLVRRLASARLPTRFGDFQLHIYEEALTGHQHLALVMGEVSGKKDVLVRVHSSCFTGDVLFSLRCDCGDQLEAAMKRISHEGRGVVLYLAQEGRGIGLLNKIRAYALQDRGMDTVQANEALGFAPDLREYGIGAQILSDLGLSTLRVLTNNPRKIIGIEGYGLRVSRRVPIETAPNRHNARYLSAKRRKLGHLLACAGLPEEL